MPSPIFEGKKQETQEWSFAKEHLTDSNGALKENGTKLRRKDHPDDITHSFMIIDNQILVVGSALGKGKSAQVKLACNSEGKLYALKRWNPPHSSLHYKHIVNTHHRESSIAKDLGVGGNVVTRHSSGKSTPSQKYCMAYDYLGLILKKYVYQYKPNEPTCWLLIANTLLEAHRLNHAEGSSKTRTPYCHDDLHLGNVLINPKTLTISIIDFERAHPEQTRKDHDYKPNLLYRNEYTFHSRIKHLGDLIKPFIGRYTIETIPLKKQAKQIEALKNRFKNAACWTKSNSNLYLYFKKEDNVSKIKETLLFDKMYYLLPLPNGGYIESHIDLTKEGFKLPIEYDESCKEYSMSNTKEEERFDQLLQKIMATHIETQANRNAPAFFKELYSQKCYKEKTFDKLLQRHSFLELSKIALLAALGIDESYYNYQESSNLLESDFLECLSHQHAFLDSIYSTFSSFKEASNDPMVQAIHQTMFSILNEESINANQALASIQEKNKQAYIAIKSTIKKIVNNLLLLKQSKEIVPSNPEKKPKTKPKFDEQIKQMYWCATLLMVTGAGISIPGSAAIAGIDIGIRSLSAHYVMVVTGLILLAIGVALCCISGIERHAQLSESGWFKQARPFRQPTTPSRPTKAL